MPAPPEAAPTLTGRLNGFVAVASGEGVEFHLYGPERPSTEPLVCFAEDGHVQVAMIGRLYYRQDLVTRLRSPHVAETRDDAGRVLDAYHQFGITGIESLEGEFALTIVDRRTRRLLASRDPMGGYPVYWCAHHSGITIGTLLQPIEKSNPGAKLDVGYFAELLTLPDGEIDYCEGTPFDTIRRLVPGSVLLADLTRGSVTVRRYWRWQDHVVEPKTDRIEELAEMYGSALREAVRERLRGNVASHLSGGMDSTSVALLAREELADRQRPLHALCLVYERLDRLTEERQYAETALATGGVVAHRIVADDLLDFDLFDGMQTYDEPFTHLFRIGTDIPLVDAADAAGCQTILTGTGAEVALDGAPFYLADLVRAGRLVRAWSEAARWAYAYNSNPWRFLRPFAITPLTPAPLAAGLKPLLRRGYADWHEQNPRAIPPWVLSDFASRGRLQRRYQARLRHSFPPASSVALSEAFGRLRYLCGDWVRYNLGAPRNIHIAHPFLDPRVLAIALGVRTRVRPQPNRQKPLLASAMRNVLPPNIVERPNKVPFNALYYEGLARNLPALEDMVRGSTVDDLGLFDKEMLIRCLRDAALGHRRFDNKAGLDNSLCIVKWLSQLPCWRSARVEPTCVYSRGIT